MPEPDSRHPGNRAGGPVGSLPDKDNANISIHGGYVCKNLSQKIYDIK